MGKCPAPTTGKVLLEGFTVIGKKGRESLDVLREDMGKADRGLLNVVTGGTKGRALGDNFVVYIVGSSAADKVVGAGELTHEAAALDPCSFSST